MSACCCGHGSLYHDRGVGACLVRLVDEKCGCKAFVLDPASLSRADLLWHCYELTGADTSGGRYTGWEADAVAAVDVQRIRLDALLAAVDAPDCPMCDGRGVERIAGSTLAEACPDCRGAGVVLPGGVQR